MLVIAWGFESPLAYQNYGRNRIKRKPKKKEKLDWEDVLIGEFFRDVGDKALRQKISDSQYMIVSSVTNNFACVGMSTFEELTNPYKINVKITEI